MSSPTPSAQRLRRIPDAAVPSLPRVLVVEDDPSILKMLNLTLQQDDLDVLTAAGGKEAVELYRQHGPTIAVVLLDVQMPDLDGPETLVALQQLNPLVRCCFMSAYTGNYSAEQLLALGAVCVLAKPFDSLKELAVKLREVAAGVVTK